MTLGTSPALCGTSVSGGEPEARRRGASFTPSRVQGPSEGADITASNPGAATAVLRRFGLSPPLLEPRFLYLCSRKGNSYPGAAEVSVRNAGGLMIPGTALGYCRWLGTWCVPGREWHLTCSSAEPCEERLLLSHFSPMWELRVTALVRLPAPNSGAGLGASPTSLLASRALGSRPVLATSQWVKLG